MVVVALAETFWDHHSETPWDLVEIHLALETLKAADAVEAVVLEAVAAETAAAVAAEAAAAEAVAAEAVAAEAETVQLRLALGQKEFVACSSWPDLKWSL